MIRENAQASTQYKAAIESDACSKDAKIRAVLNYTQMLKTSNS